MQLEYTMFNDSVKKHQQLIDLIAKKIDNNEPITREILANEMGLSKGWIDKARQQINTEDECIDYKVGNVQLNYRNLLEKGVYSIIKQMIEDSEINFPVFLFDNKKLSDIYHIKIKTVQMYRAYIRENMPKICYVWEKNQDYLQEIMNNVKKME